MLNLHRSKDNKWIFQKNISSTDLVKDFLDAIEIQGNSTNKGGLKAILQAKDSYKGRSSNGSENTMGVRMSQMCFYMFGYKKDEVFFPSPTTEMLMRDNSFDKEDAFLVNLFSIQFPSPFSKTPDNFHIYVGRLLIKLLLDERIGEKIYIDEFARFLMFIEEVDEKIYEELIKEILKYRELTYEEKLRLFMSVPNYDDVFSNCLHEANYYFSRIFNGFGVFDLIEDPKHNRGNLFRFRHGTGDTFRNDAAVSKGKIPGYIALNPILKEKARILSENFSAFDIPESQASALSKNEWIRNLYEFNMSLYIQSLNKDDEYNMKVLEIINHMIRESRYGTDDGRSFEYSVQPVFDLFRETVYSEVIGGSGDTDMYCIIKKPDEDKFNINVEAKKRKGRLAEINQNRINEHLVKNGSEYCVIVPPDFSIGVKRDIKNGKMVLLKAETLANYCLKECINSEDGLADFIVIDNYIKNNYGTDITPFVESLITERYGITNN